MDRDEMIELFDYLEAMEEWAEEEAMKDWMLVDRTDFGCLFVNHRGEARYIGASYIDRLFEEE